MDCLLVLALDLQGRDTIHTKWTLVASGNGHFQLSVTCTQEENLAELRERKRPQTWYRRYVPEPVSFSKRLARLSIASMRQSLTTVA